MALYYATAPFAAADVVFLGVPLDRTSSFVPGCRFGPAFVRIGADNIESYSPYQHRDVSSVRVHDAGDVELSYTSPAAPLDAIANRLRPILAAGKKFLAFGGEHTITYATVSTVVEKFPDLCVIQFDAHSDLREEFLGEKVCHATAMRRVLDFISRSRLFQLGIRSFADATEMSVEGMYPFSVEEFIPEVRAKVLDRPVYITIDIDVLDPSAMPDVQTPEPGGSSYRQLACALAALSGLHIVGVDIVEFCPRGNQPSLGAATAASLVREAILILRPERKQ